jgi:hypothetical protein
MTYTLQYHEESANVSPTEAAKIISHLTEWEANDTNPDDGINRFGGVAYDHDRGAIRVTCYAEEIPESKAPQGIKSDFDTLAEQSNGNFGTDFALPSEAAEIQSRG